MLSRIPDSDQSGHIAFELYGVRLVVETASNVLASRVLASLPPCASICDAADGDERFVLAADDGGSYRVDSPDMTVSASVDVEIALSVLDARLRSRIAERAPGHIFVHAGVVGYRGKAIVLPGASFSGKSTLVYELIQAGAIYYSDEYAVLDAEGLVHPYARPLSIRDAGHGAIDYRVESLGAVAGVQPLPVGLVAITEYRPDAQWRPSPLSPGEAVLALLANTVPAQERPRQSLAAIRRAAEGQPALEGERGEAAPVARDLLARVRRVA
jgi:hypothetical protein